jgi:hypothetical protein
MKRGYREFRTIAALALATLAFVLTIPAAQAGAVPTGSAPWYRQSTAGAQARARALFEQALDKHQELLRAEAMELYEQALALWDNPDIRWNLALVLEDLGQHVRAHEQLEGVLHWGGALGPERLREVQDRMRVLETQRLAQIETISTEPGADVKLDGQPWFQGEGQHSILVLPGTHYIASTKPGYLPVTVSASMVAGERYRVTLQMTADRRIETRRWVAWKPWSAVTAGVAIGIAGGFLERRALAHRDAAGKELAAACSPPACDPGPFPESYRQAVMQNRIAIGAFAAGGTAIAVGLVLAWLNQPSSHHVEAAPSPIEVMPGISPGRVDVSASLRF